MGESSPKPKEIEIVIPVIEIIDEYSRLLTNLKKNHRRGKSLACLSSLAAIKPLHSHLMEILVNDLEGKTSSVDQSETKAPSQNFFGYL
jgi:hypothetical protein